MNTREQQLQTFDRLLTIMQQLRQECPWDKKQTFDSLRPNTIEETYELASAIMKHDMREISKELGDVLLHVVFYAQMGSETDDFDIADVCNQLCDKLIFRHPHIYGNAQADTDTDVKQNWEQLKLKEKGGNKTVLAGVPEALPALVKAYRIQDKARNAGFDWDERAQVWDKVQEEIHEFQEAVDAMNADEMEAEFGDVLFSLVNAARLYNIHPDNALERTNRKFIRRFNYLEQRVREQGKSLQNMTLAEMEQIWQEAKKEE
ncbi:MAG: nucleoside triphosphate pyrophosphohydrolase [Paludibacter sp.]|nr:nucleoside triphosphate pyrophosphohydrolase [Bacteroidales bacterium]MCM1069783.1 nucleoside triphosphate pyrophosphohydrolase [Prevotella sp.]MCM1354505.1 nucleoside triphosphate pyrophosphohydrolase [Bacteroides sp.]MCM1443308.1 nucleoside triphosphate pyrophosphohydrolase [Muribaculum sp.]MCM1482432.1 nucleoside triphosphate pyrophosphohydrolase [Paludibacter sp.]